MPQYLVSLAFSFHSVDRGLIVKKRYRQFHCQQVWTSEVFDEYVPCQIIQVSVVHYRIVIAQLPDIPVCTILQRLLRDNCVF